MNTVLTHIGQAMQAHVIIPAVWTICAVFSALKVSACRSFYPSTTVARPIVKDGAAYLYDFTSGSNDYLASWHESSDTTREVGMSKASFVMQVTQKFSRAVFFALLNPQPNGACFAGFKTDTSIDLKGFNAISLKLRAQGSIKRFKVTLRHKNEEANGGKPSYQHIFEAPHGDLTEIRLLLSDFKAYYRGKLQPDADPLDTSNITQFGIQAFGGVYEKDKQHGTGSLEVDWIKASK